MGTYEELVPGQFLIDPAMRYRDKRILDFNFMSKLASDNKKINEEKAYV